jgi:hypothetical protein
LQVIRTTLTDMLGLSTTHQGGSMGARRISAIVYAVITVGIVAFQMAMAAGMPWGSYAMGGAYPGVFPPALRVAALVQAALLAVCALVVLARADVALVSWARASGVAIWFVVALSSVSLVLNVITPSGGERAVWAPVAAVLLASSLVVAITSRSSQPT